MAESNSPSPASRSAASTLRHCGGHCAADAALLCKWKRARMQVRLCTDPDEPRLVEQVFDVGRGVLAQGQMSPWEVAWQSAQLLLDTAADPALPLHWRSLCLDHLHIPLQELARCADDAARLQQLAELRWRLATFAPRVHD